MTDTSRNPIKVEVLNEPSTGFKRPFEVWTTYKSGNKRRISSFKTEIKANEKAQEIKERFQLV